MSKGNVDKFLGLMQKDEGLAKKMAACLYKLETNVGKAEGLGGFISREIVPLAKEYGLEFTAQDLLDYTEEAKAKAGLTTEDLADVSGGKGGVRAALMGTLALLGVAAAPAAMEMVSGGEVSPVSMVASAETPNEEKSEQATPEQLDELQLGIAALKSLKGTISSSKLEEKEKDMLSRRCVSFLNKGEQSLKSELKKDVEQSVKDITGFVNYLRSQGVTNNWFERRETLATLENRISLLEGKTFLNHQEIANLRNIANTLKKNLIYLKKEQGKEKKATGTNANDFEAKIKSFEDILARAEKLNKNKEQLVQNLQKVQSLVNYNEGKKINEQIAALNDEIKDFSPENIAKKEADFNAINAFTNAIIEVNNLQKEVDDLLKTRGANQNILNDIKGALDIAARDLTKENAAISKVLTEIKKKLNAEKENIKKIKAESIEKKEQKKKDQEEKDKKANTVDFFTTTKENAENTLPKLKDRLDGLENFVVNVQKRTDAASVQESINRLRARIDSFGDIKYENANEKATELERLEKDVNAMVTTNETFIAKTNEFSSIKETVKTLLAQFKKICNDKDQLDKFKELEQELNAMKKAPDNSDDLLAALTRISRIKTSIPQIKAMLNKATVLKKIAEQVDANFADVFDNIIKEIEAADSVDKINLAEETLQNAEKTLRGLMRTKINKANKMAPILYETAKTIGLDQLADNLLDLMETIEGFNYDAAITAIYNLYLETGLFNAAEKDLPELLSEQIDVLKKQARVYDYGNAGYTSIGALMKAGGFEQTLETLQDECKKPLTSDELNNLLHQVVAKEGELRKKMVDKLLAVKEEAYLLANKCAQLEFQYMKDLFMLVHNELKDFNGDSALSFKDVFDKFYKVFTFNDYKNGLKDELIMKGQIPLLKEQATKLKDMATDINENQLAWKLGTIVDNLEKVKLEGDLAQISGDVATAKNSIDNFAKELAEKLNLSEEIDELLKNEVMGAEIQDELKAIKAGLPKADEANADTVVKAFVDVKAVKTKMANKLLEWHKLLSEYHNKGYHKEGVEEVQSLVETNLETLKGGADKMLAGADEVKLNAENLNFFAKIALKIAENLNTDIADVIATIESYIGFGGLDLTAGTQANTLVTFLRDKVGDVHALKFVDKQTRAKLAKNIKEIFDQIKIDQETGKYYLPPLYNRYAVNHDDLKLICDAYDVIAEDFGERVSYTPFVEGTTETTSGWSFSGIWDRITEAKEQRQLINKTTHLINELKKVSRLDLLDVSPESREALKKDIIEISTQMKSRARSWRFHKLYYYFPGIADSQTKNLQDGLVRISEFYSYLNCQR